MSLFHPMNLTCPACEEIITYEAVGSVNADRRPDFRDDILNDAFQDVVCGKCNDSFRLQPEFNYLDVGNRLWIAAMPAVQVFDYIQVEDDSSNLFKSSYGADAPNAAQEVGNSLDVRVTFGWPSMREKIYARVNGIDDLALELTKLEILRRVPDAPLSPGIELRLVNIADETMVFLWIRSDTEESLQELAVDRSIYDGVVNNLEAWSAVRAIVENGPFVDMQKIYLGEGR